MRTGLVAFKFYLIWDEKTLDQEVWMQSGTFSCYEPSSDSAMFTSHV